MQHNFDVSPQNEFANIDLGDRRLNRRIQIISEDLSRQPNKSFPESASTTAALEATYRFLRNPKVTMDKILQPHIEATISRAAATKSRVVVAHDTTVMSFSGESRADLGWVTGKSVSGNFLTHVSLAIERSENPRPLGVLKAIPTFRTGKVKSRNPRRGKRDRSGSSESDRWFESINETQNLFPTGLDPIHVADREADNYELFSNLLQSSSRFVIRVRFDRAGCKANKAKPKKLFEILDGLEMICEREVAVSKRTLKMPNKLKDRQARPSRAAKLGVFASRITIPRTLYQHADLPKSLTLNVVHVRELDAPLGQVPVDWKLFTSEPINNEHDVLNIVDDYRSRWIIEEYFKALKTGCAYEKRQVETKPTILNTLAIFIPIAWQLLMLKSSGFTEYSCLADEVLSPTQLEVLQAVNPKPLPVPLDLRSAMLAVAALGGHIPYNGNPGWQVLNRGMQKLLTMELVWIAAKK